MNKYLGLPGSIAGIVGALICLTSGFARVMGYHYIAGYQSTTLFNVGVGLMVFACLLKLEALIRPEGTP